MPQELVVFSYGIVVSYRYYDVLLHKVRLLKILHSVQDDNGMFRMTTACSSDNGQFWRQEGLYGYWRRNTWIRVIIYEFKILVLEIEDALHVRINLHLRELARLA